MTSDALGEGDRVRVLSAVGDSLSKFVGAEGTVACLPDQFGRYGVRLDKFPRAQKHWFHWFHAERLERLPPEVA